MAAYKTPPEMSFIDLPIPGSFDPQPRSPTRSPSYPEQVGGGRRRTCPEEPNLEMPTRFRTHVSPTKKDEGFIGEASKRRAQLLPVSHASTTKLATDSKPPPPQSSSSHRPLPLDPSTHPDAHPPVKPSYPSAATPSATAFIDSGLDKFLAYEGFESIELPPGPTSQHSVHDRGREPDSRQLNVRPAPRSRSRSHSASQDHLGRRGTGSPSLVPQGSHNPSAVQGPDHHPYFQTQPYEEPAVFRSAPSHSGLYSDNYAYAPMHEQQARRSRSQNPPPPTTQSRTIDYPPDDRWTSYPGPSTSHAPPDHPYPQLPLQSPYYIPDERSYDAHDAPAAPLVVPISPATQEAFPHPSGSAQALCHPPVTKVIPPTPIAQRVGGDHPGELQQPPSVPTPDDHMVSSSAQNDVFGPDLYAFASSPSSPDGAGSEPRRGRPSNATLQIVATGFEEMDRIARRISDDTDMDPSQVADWYRRHQRAGVVRNPWNIYGQYFNEHIKQELKRVKGAKLIEGSDNVNVRSACYKAFKRDHPHHWEEMLETFETMLLYSTTSHTVARRAREFDRVAEAMIRMANLNAIKHSLDIAFVIGGNVVNQDSSLAKVYETSGATGFFEQRCRADADTLIGHFKSHIYDKVSMSAVAEAFDDDDESGEGSKDAAEHRVEDGSLKGSDLEILRDALRRAFVAEGGKWPSQNLLPWKVLRKLLADQGIRLTKKSGMHAYRIRQ
ncbi:hypothetical protein PLICRDRAFT_179314 [Plicaturopsis crispa FD-325 SS-3]|uniref:Uncharacterized protein n=1 Tax=Plicaturopsis crispa FD-325 SS-3 TaxID=944288 RepID=A0A0C9T8F5_PLICR|nr:hypothetical protein PLICRDRAFT_179314 [Plicaturopsis crispa FD-325 SS-3]